MAGHDFPQNSLLTTKLYVPAGRPNLVERSRLTSRLNTATNQGQKLTLISAPAGFGKTTLLAEWIPKSQQCITWVSLDEADNNPIRFWTYFIAALQMLRPDLGENTQAMLDALGQQPGPPRPESFLTILINEIAAFPDKFTLVLDDYHVIHTAAIHDGLTFLFDHLPPPIHLTVTSRADPPLPLARWRARGQLTEIHADDLRFTPEEVATFINQAMGLELPAEAINALEDRTEGWIAGLKLAAHSLKGRNPEDQHSFITAFTGSNRYILDYLVEEVFNQQPENVQRFLLQTSILERLNAPLCDTVTESSDSGEMLERLERACLFIVPLDEERQWYRYHHLFADVLRYRLGREHREKVAELRQRASQWFEQNGFVTEALSHAVAAKNFEYASHLIEAYWPTMIDRGDGSTLLPWLDSFPAEMIRSRPRLALAKAWAVVLQDRLEEAREYAAEAERWARHEDPANTEARSILGEAAAVHASIAIILDDAPGIVDAARRALGYLPPEQRYWRANISTNLAYAHMLLGDLPAAQRAIDEGLREGHAMRNPVLLCFAYSCVGGIARVQGYLHRAADALHKAVEAAQTRAGNYLRMATLPHRNLAELLYEWNDLNSAHRHINLAIDLGRSWWVRDEMIKCYMLLARVEQALGNEDAALSALKQAEELTDERYAFYLVAQVGLPFIRQWLAAGLLQPAIFWGENMLQIHSPGSDLTFAQSYELTTLARLLLAQEKPEPALTILDSLLPCTKKKHLTSITIDALVLQALALLVSEDMPGALERLNQVLSLAQPQGYVRTFVDEGEAMHALLRRVTGRTRRYAAALLGILEASRNLGMLTKTRNDVAELPGAMLIDPLSQRELELLPFLAAGLSNQDIARKLHISPGTVKAHLKHIYAKLDVNSRTQAVAKARELNLLAE